MGKYYDYDTTLELRLDLERKLEKALGVGADGKFFLGVDQMFARMDRVVHPMGHYSLGSYMALALQRLRLISRTDNPRDLANAIVMHCSFIETQAILDETRRMAAA